MKIRYDTGCRICMQSTGISTVVLRIGDDAREWKTKTEFRVMQEIEHWRKNDEVKCENCGALEVEVFNVYVDSYPLYDFDRLAMRCNVDDLFMIDITKKNGRLILKSGGNRSPSRKFVLASLDRMIEQVNETQTSCFKEYHRGRFFMCFLGVHDWENETFQAIPQRFVTHGLTRQEIISEITSFKNQY